MEELNFPGALPPGFPAVITDDEDELRRLSESSAGFIGLAPGFSADCKVESLAFATADSILVLDVLLSEGDLEPIQKNRVASLLKTILGRPKIVGLDMARVALCIYRDLRIHVQAVDLSTASSGTNLIPHSPLRMAQTTSASLLEPARFLERALSPNGGQSSSDLAAICSYFSVQLASAWEAKEKTRSFCSLTTTRLGEKELELLGEMQLQWDQLESFKPTSFENDFDSITYKNRDVQIQNARYATKVRAQADVLITYEDGETVTGRATGAKGKETIIRLKDGKGTNTMTTVKSIHVVGRDAPTYAELARKAWLLRLLQGGLSFGPHSQIIRSIWFPSKEDEDRIQFERNRVAENVGFVESRVLNASQTTAAGTMLCPGYHTLVITQGPPGTGKTRTICEAVKQWSAQGEPSWLVAQSNVGVKNIAESLSSNGFDDYKLIVSAEFYEEWHEHIYAAVRKNLVRSDELPAKGIPMQRFLVNSPVILCTLSMLSNSVIAARGMFESNPVTNLVIDEASQIYVGEYLHLFHRFNSLKKVCWFGDPMQLPPYGSDNTEHVPTIFDVPHLKDSSLFLDTSYRMPTAITHFISFEVYGGNLLSRHKIRSTNCLALVDVFKGTEESVGTSWKNVEEAQTIVRLVDKYYQDKPYVVITPYDAQRSLIDQLLKAANPDWKGKVFNVDSFQGNEADFVLISVTRTTRAGFLKSLERVNVMLTRCKQGMVIVTKKSFLKQTDAGDTLVGRIMKQWEIDVNNPWTDWRKVAEGTAEMPGIKVAKARDDEYTFDSFGSQPRSKPNRIRPGQTDPSLNYGYIRFQD